MAEMLAFVKIVCSHYRPCASFLNRSLEGREIDFVQGPVVDDGIVLVTETFLIVQGEVLHADGDTVLLDLLNIRDNHSGSEVRVLAHIFEIPAVERSPVDVHSGTEQHILLPVSCLFSYALAVQCGHFLAPGGCKAGQCREGHAGVIGPSRLSPFIPKHLRPDSVRAVGGPQVRYAEPRNSRRGEFALCMENFDLLLQCHPGECILHPLFKRPALVEIDRCLRLPFGLPAGQDCPDCGGHGANCC